MIALTTYPISKQFEHVIGINEDYIFLSITHGFAYDEKLQTYVESYTLQTLTNKDTPLIALKVKLLEYREVYPSDTVKRLPFIQLETDHQVSKSALLLIKK